MGIIFPFYAHFFVVYKSSSLQQLFIIGSIPAGIAVGITAFLITRFTILHVIKMVSKEMESIAEGLQKISDNAFELSEGSKEILQAMTSLDKTQIEIKEGSGEIQKGVDKIVESMADVRNLSGEILELLKGIDFGVTDITKVIVRVSDESNNLKKTIRTMNSEVTKFQVSEG